MSDSERQSDLGALINCRKYVMLQMTLFNNCHKSDFLSNLLLCNLAPPGITAKPLVSAWACTDITPLPFFPDMSSFPLLQVGGAQTWMSPECVSLNRLPMRATLYPFPEADAARTRPARGFALVPAPRRTMALPHGRAARRTDRRRHRRRHRPFRLGRGRRAGQLDAPGLRPSALHQCANALAGRAAVRARRQSHRRLREDRPVPAGLGKAAASSSISVARRACSTSTSTASPWA